MILSKARNSFIGGGNPPNPSYLAHVTLTLYYLGVLFEEPDKNPDSRIQASHSSCNHGPAGIILK